MSRHTEVMRGAHVVSTTPLVITRTMALQPVGIDDGPAMAFEALAEVEIALAEALSFIATQSTTLEAKEAFGALSKRRRDQAAAYRRIAAEA